VLKTNYAPIQDLRRFRVHSKQFDYAQLQLMLQQLYDNVINSKHFIVKYQDDDGDLITIANDLDLQEAFRWISEQNRTNKDQKRLLPLHLVVISADSAPSSKQKLVDVTDIFIQQLKNLQISSPDSNCASFNPATPGESKKGQKKTALIMGSEWRGILTYLDEDQEKFPLILRIDKVKGEFVEGLICWPSLGGAVTKWLGKRCLKYNCLKFTEYEAVIGEENVELPADYTCEISADKMNGFLLDPANKGKSLEEQKNTTLASFQLQFSGLQTDDGFLEAIRESNSNLPSLNSKKRKYGLVNNSNIEAPSVNDRMSSFLKLTAGSDCWYQKKRIRTDDGKETKTTTTTTPTIFRQSCPNCREPLSEKVDISGNTIMGCSSYPRCMPRYYDSDDEY